MARIRSIFAAGLGLLALTASPAAADIVSGEPLPRIEASICPGVMGMETEAALQLIDRIRQNAERLQIGLADPDSCAPNLLVTVVEDGKQSVASLMNSQPRLFETLTLAERRALQSASGPARAWNVVDTRTRDGMWVPGGGISADDFARAKTWSSHSRINVPTRRDIISSVVMFDKASVAGLTTTQLADYATMRSFAADFTAFPVTGNSILALFDGASSSPAELTRFDLAFLEGLYSGAANVPARSKNRSIEQQLAGIEDE